MDSAGILQLVVKSGISAGFALGHFAEIVIPVGYHLGGAAVQYIYRAASQVVCVQIVILCSFTLSRSSKGIGLIQQVKGFQAIVCVCGIQHAAKLMPWVPNQLKLGNPDMGPTIDLFHKSG